MLKKNIAYLVVTVLLFGLCYWVLQKPDVSNLESILTKEQAESIKGFAFKKAGRTINIDHKKDLGWVVNGLGIKNYPADMNLVQKLIQKLNSKNILNIDSSNNKDPSFVLEVLLDHGLNKKLKIYSEKTYDNQSFLLFENVIYVSEPFWVEIFDKFEFRQKEVFLLNYGLMRFTLNYKGEKRTFKYDEQNKIWLSSEGNRRVIVDKEMVKFFQKLMKIKIFRFMNKNEKVEKEIAHQISFEYKDRRKNWNLHLSEGATEIFGRIVQLETSFEIKGSSLVTFREALNLIE